MTTDLAGVLGLDFTGRNCFASTTEVKAQLPATIANSPNELAGVGMCELACGALAVA